MTMEGNGGALSGSGAGGIVGFGDFVSPDDIAASSGLVSLDDVATSGDFVAAGDVTTD